MQLPADFDRHLMSAIERVWALVEDIGRRTADPPGITRPAWGEQEELAADAVCDFAPLEGLQALRDPFGNIIMLLHGQDPGAPAVTSGSHLDTVPHGGNYDGLAGVAAGLAVVAAAKSAGAKAAGAAVPLRAIAMRCEESPWYGTAYLGSRLMLGLSTLDDIGSLVRFDNGRTLRQNAEALGYPRRGAPVAPRLNKDNVRSFLELHIEQGPLLETEAIPVGIATAVRGNVRFPNARCVGAYAHSAALPRRFRQDAVLAVAQLMLAVDEYWARRIAAGDEDFVATFGKFSTDPALHAMTKVPGEVTFSINIGATSKATQDEARGFILDLVKTIARERNVVFELGEEVGRAPTPLNEAMLLLLEDSARASGIRTRRMPTVGHDTAMFMRAGIPAAMILVRNQNGSHNPHEALQADDFAAGVRVLAGAMLRLAA